MAYRLLFDLLLARIDPERAHAIAGRALGLLDRLAPLRALVRALLAPRDPALRVHALGLTFPSPVGVAAGFDKDGRWPLALQALGFGFVEAGTVTAIAQEGNPRPRVWRMPAQHALRNAMGFPNEGAAAVAARLSSERARAGRGGVVGVNVGKSRAVDLEGAEADYRAAVREVAGVADFLVLNVSSPNTPGLRELQSPGRLASLVDAVRAELAAVGVEVPLLVKIDPDLSDAEVDAVCDVVVAHGLDGIVAVNTTAAEGLAGGVSGAPLAARSLAVLGRVRARVGDKPVVISVGGIADADDVLERLGAGATLVQAYTAFVYGGPLWAWRVNRGVARGVRARQ